MSRLWSLALIGMLAAPITSLRCQNNVLDLKFVEVNNDGDVTYQNFLYARSFRDGKYMAQALYLRLPTAKYEEIAVGGAVRAATVGDIAVYLMTSFGSATDANYVEPAVLVQDVKGRVTGSLYLQRYTPVDDAGIVQWLVDALEVQYAVRGPLALGAALYAYRPEGGAWLTKIGPKIAFADKHGSTELRVTTVSQGGGREVQLRRIFVF